jgi:hypothetical protein
MLRLSNDQVDLLDQLVTRRHAALISAVLAEAWPAMTERLKERWPAFVEAAALQARKHGITDVAGLARYASLWCIWGPAFDDKPGFEWAREILADPRRSPALKLHQLVHRSREELGRRQPTGPSAAPVLTPAAFDAALATIEAQMLTMGAARTVFPAEREPPVIKACDLGVVDLMIAEAENLLEYRRSPVGWQRGAVPRIGTEPIHWTRAPELGPTLAVPSHALRAGPAARLNLKLQMHAVCDPKLHPGVVHQSAQGRLAWAGRDAARLSVALYALPLDAAAPTPGIAARLPADVQTVQLTSCGTRDAGAPFGAVNFAVSVFPATQWLTEVRHAAWPAVAWPDDANTPVPVVPGAVAVRLEADGQPRDVATWQRSWAGLQGKFRQGMEKLFNDWARAVASSPRLEVEASPMVGEAGLTWGYRRTAADNVEMRTEGLLDLLAFAVDLSLTGELGHGSARARATLACKGRIELRMPVAQLGDTAEDGKGLTAALRTWRLPFTLDVEPLASPDLATLSAAPMPEAMLGALVGEAGLRLRPDGGGWQWFFQLRCEPVTVSLVCADPMLGASSVQRPLLPGGALVDWSAG